MVSGASLMLLDSGLGHATYGLRVDMALWSQARKRCETACTADLCVVLGPLYKVHIVSLAGSSRDEDDQYNLYYRLA